MTDSPPPKITIGICAYKSADTVERSIQSALNQDWPNIELIVVNDSPEDNETGAVLQAALQGHANAHLITHTENKGFASALNTVIENATGDFIAIFDDDDISHPDRLRKQYERLTTYEQKTGAPLVICHTARTQHYPDDHTRYEPTMGTAKGAEPFGLQVVDRILMGRLSPGVVGSCANCSRMARTSLFRKLGGYDTTMRRGEDTDFNIRLGLMGGHFVGIAEPLVEQTMTMGHEKTFRAEKTAEEIILEKHRSYLIQNGWYYFCRRWLDLRYLFLRNAYLPLFTGLSLLALRAPVKTIRKLIWMIPSTPTRRHFKKWHHQTEKTLA